MSDTDSFIDEVSEEVRRDRLFTLVKRYGWIAVLVVVLLVGGAGWNEWRKASERHTAQAFGDAILSALSETESADRADALATVMAPTEAGDAILTLLTASEEREDSPERAAERLIALSQEPNVPQIYRQLALLKAVTIADSGLSLQDRRQHVEGLALATGLVRLLAEEQLAIIELEEGAEDAAVERLQRIVEDEEATAGLRQRVTEVIEALGGDLAE